MAFDSCREWTRRERNTAEMRNKYKITSKVKRISTLESLKQRLSATSYRLKRFKKRQLHYNQNYTFENNPQKGYRELREERVEITNPPTKEEIENFGDQSTKMINHITTTRNG